MTFDFLSVVRMAGGLALFLYGMTIMGSGLERASPRTDPGTHDRQPAQRPADGSCCYGCYPVVVCNDRHGGRICQCRNFEPAAVGRRDYGR